MTTPAPIDPAVARALVLERISALPSEHVELHDALDRVLAVDAVASDAVPPFDGSAMDGFAVRAADIAGASPEQPVVLPISGESRAGRPANAPLAAGSAIRISTGAVVPDGADTVVRIEDTLDRDDGVAIRAAAASGSNVRRAGDDIKAGEVVLRRGSLLGPAELGVLATVGSGGVECFRRPRVAVLATGDELRSPGEPLGPGQIRNSNLYTVTAQARRAGAEIVLAETVPDDLTATVAALRSALSSADLVAICGGVSVGPHDHVKPALAELGVEQVFWGVAQRPGRPLWFGIGAGAGAREVPVFGLPGNPVSTMVTFHVYGRPALLVQSGRETGVQRVSAIFDEDYDKRAGRAHFVRCRLELRDDGWHASVTKNQSSHVLTSMLGAAGLAELAVDRGPVAAGERADVQLMP